MIISDIRFGLGNQIFQYAIGKSLSLRLNTEFRICIDSINPYSATEYQFHLDKFKIEAAIISYEEAIKQINNTKFHKLLSRIFPTYRKMYFDQMQGFDQKFLSLRSKDIFVSGCFQSYKYFEDIKLELQSDFTPINQPKPTELVEKIKNNNSVSLHIETGLKTNLQ